MMRLGKLGLVLAVVAMASGPALAQQRQPGGRGFGGFGGSPLFLLAQKSVQDELKLSEDQVKKVKDLSDKQRGSFQGLRDLSPEERQKKMQEARKANDKAVADILKAEQLKRLKQISLQQRGARAFSDPETAKALHLTDGQTEKVKTILEASRPAGGQRGQRGQRTEEERQKLDAARKATNEKLMNVLTSEQKAKWKELTGEPFKGEIRRPEFGGRNRQTPRPAR